MSTIERRDGQIKAAGKARYSADYAVEGLAQAVVLGSTIPAGRILSIDGSRAEALPGVLAVITHRNAPRLLPPPRDRMLGSAAPPPLQDDWIDHDDQHIAVVVAETLEDAQYASTLIRVSYERHEARLESTVVAGELFTPRRPRDTLRGDPEAGLAEADMRVLAESFVAPEHNNPMGPFSTTAVWSGHHRLTVYDATQWSTWCRRVLAACFALPEDNIEVIAPYVGGAFGAGLRVWQHVPLAAVAARHVGRPVRLTLSRAQMFTMVGHRPATGQRLMVAATRDGRLTALEHRGVQPAPMRDDYSENLAGATRALYACPNVRTTYRQVRRNISTPTWMRAPGEAQGGHALEVAIDELASMLSLDPLELRERNMATADPVTGRPWSSNGLAECYRVGAERFGWARRDPRPGSMRDGDLLVGWGMAAATYPYHVDSGGALMHIDLNGHVLVQTAVTDIGTGTGTVLAQIAADTLGVPVEAVHVELGVGSLPFATAQGGSKVTASTGSAVARAAEELRERLIELARANPAPPPGGRGSRVPPGRPLQITEGRIHPVRAPRKGEDLASLVRRAAPEGLTVESLFTPDPDPALAGRAFGAKFAEVTVDPELGEIRVRRIVAVIEGGTIVNERTARSQIIGGTIGGIGMALLEEGRLDPAFGRMTNADLSEYLIPTCADTPEIDVAFVHADDPHINPIGVKGIGEIGLVGVAPAIANAVHHATGRRIRDLPITLDRLL